MGSNIFFVICLDCNYIKNIISYLFLEEKKYERGSNITAVLD